jgi:hypothetical protein
LEKNNFSPRELLFILKFIISHIYHTNYKKPQRQTKALSVLHFYEKEHKKTHRFSLSVQKEIQKIKTTGVFPNTRSF